MEDYVLHILEFCQQLLQVNTLASHLIISKSSSIYCTETMCVSVAQVFIFRCSSPLYHWQMEKLIFQFIKSM